jgi:hypothetical protein
MISEGALMVGFKTISLTSVREIIRGIILVIARVNSKEKSLDLSDLKVCSISLLYHNKN